MPWNGTSRTLTGCLLAVDERQQGRREPNRGDPHPVYAYYSMSEFAFSQERVGLDPWPARLRVLLDRALDVASEHDLLAVLQRIVEGAAEVAGARYSALGVYDADGMITSFVHHGLDAETIARIGNEPRGRGLLGQVIVTDRPIRVADIGCDPRSCGFPEHHPPMRSFLGAPISRGGRRFGNLYLTDKRDGTEFSEDDEALVMALAAFAASAIESAELVSVERARAEAVSRQVAAEASERARREVLSAVIAAQESERARVSRDLHDDIGQALTSVLLGLHLIESSAQHGIDVGDDTSRRVDELRQLVGDALRRTRHLAFELRPTVLDDVGLAPALARLVADTSERSGVSVDAVVDSAPELAKVSSDIATVVYRVVQEALTNVVRHARATSASVAVTAAGGRLRALVEDNGIGFDPTDPAHGHLGLQGMSERAEIVGGTVRVASVSGSGTTIVLEIPLV